MKTLLLLAELHNSTVILLKFKHKNIIKVGYGIVDKNSNELMSFEPCNYSNGDKWIVRNNCAGGTGMTYIKSLKQASKYRHDVREGFTGVKLIKA